MLGRLVDRYIESMKTKPIQTRLVTTSVLTVSANAISQKLIERSDSFDWDRLRKVLVASLVLSVIRQYQFKFINDMFPTKNGGIYPIIGQLLLDQLVFAPLTNALFFILMSIQNNQKVTPQGVIVKLIPTMKMYWRVWPLAKLFNFWFVPITFRPLFSDLVGFFWGIFLSGMTKRKRISSK